MGPRPPQEDTVQQSSKRAKDTDNSSARSPGHAEHRPPPKRARKAINCEPCRSSKLKCDRARPCSSCVLRGTASSCYQDADGRVDEQFATRVDPHHEIAQIRQSLATLEAHLLRGGPTSPLPISLSSNPTPSAPGPSTPVTKLEPDDTFPEVVPGMLVGPSQGELYAGPTSTASHLLTFRSPDETEEEDMTRINSEDPAQFQLLESQVQRRYDDDLISRLPALHIVDGLVDYYFEYCNWIYRHVDQQAFSAAFARFKSGVSSDRLTLATLCVIIAIAVRYLPHRHALLTSLARTHEELAEEFYDIAKQAFSRHQSETHALSLDLIEFFLIRTHYLTLSKTEPEELWAIRGELVTLSTAMGLHRDPDKWRMSRELAERRRWAWWHIVLLERWQCFLFGRPLAIASHHFDTRTPSAAHPNLSTDPQGRYYRPNLHLFRLAHVIGDVVDDAVSVRPVPYERIQKRDRILVEVMDSLPKELDMDDYRLARALSSPIPSVMRLGVQSVVIRMLYYHVRFTLHRPYVAALRNPSRKSSDGSVDPRMAQSLDTSVHAADKLIQLVAQTRQDLLANSSLAVPGHVHWGPFHCFSAAMFFSFQLIADPNQPGANLFRANIRRALDVLGHSRGVPIADKAADVLQALVPLYNSQQDGTPEGVAARERKKKGVLRLVRNLAFPYQGSSVHTFGHAESPSSAAASRYSVDSPLRTNSISPPNPVLGFDSAGSTGPSTSYQPMVVQQGPQPQMPERHQWTERQQMQAQLYQAPSYQPPATVQPQAAPSQLPPSPYHNQSRQPVLQAPLHQHLQSITSSSVQYAPHQDRGMYAPVQQHQQMRSRLQSSPAEAMWVASVGFGQGEWARFLDVVQKHDGPQAQPGLGAA